jgi:hypothetical protein
MDGSKSAGTFREAIALFRDPEAFNGAISDLTSAGVDRADMSILAQEAILEGTVSQPYRDTSLAADNPNTPRQAVFSDTDVQQGRTLLTSMASVIAALAASGTVVLTGGAAQPALAAAATAGAGVGAIGALVGKQVGDERRRYLEEQMAHGGILLWIKISNPAQEVRMRQILERHAARDIHVNETSL